jgi:hypothetical protein
MMDEHVLHIRIIFFSKCEDCYFPKPYKIFVLPLRVKAKSVHW